MNLTSCHGASSAPHCWTNAVREACSPSSCHPSYLCPPSCLFLCPFHPSHPSLSCSPLSRPLISMNLTSCHGASSAPHCWTNAVREACSPSSCHPSYLYPPSCLFLCPFHPSHPSLS